MKNLIHSHEIEQCYCEDYSEKRYLNTEKNYFCTLIPYKKMYIQPKSKRANRANYAIELGKLLKHSMKIRRLDLLSYYSDHNNSASVRCLHSAMPLFLYNSKLYFYHLYYDELYLISDEIKDAKLSENKIYILGVSDILNLSRYYGDFAIYASLLEAGHLLFNIQNNMTLNSVNYKFIKCHQNLLSNSSLDSRYFYSNFFIETEFNTIFNPDIDSNQINTARDIRLDWHFDDIIESVYARNLVNKFNNDAYEYKGLELPQNILIEENEQQLIRNSAHSTIGNFNYLENFSDFSAEDLLQRLNQIVQQNNLANSMFVHIIEKVNNDNYRIYTLDKKNNKRIKPFNLNHLFATNAKNFDLNTYRYIVILSSTDSKKHLRKTLINCGQIMQYCSLYTTNAGYPFRPMKNHNDKYIKHILNMNTKNDYQVIYMGVVMCETKEQISYYFN